MHESEVERVGARELDDEVIVDERSDRFEDEAHRHVAEGRDALLKGLGNSAAHDPSELAVWRPPSSRQPASHGAADLGRFDLPAEHP